MKKRVLSNIISRSFGKFASHRFHPMLQKFINHSYVRLLGLDMSEFKKASDYKSLNELFTRSLLNQRNIEVGIVSPTDSLITACGKIQKDKALQIKGMEYSIKDLLQECDASTIFDGEYVNLYLSPRDYHRYHMPYTLKIERVIHIPGKLYPVNLRFLRKKLNLFIENERVILECSTKDGNRVYIVLVGALNVGKMTLVFESRIETNRSREIAIYEYSDLWLQKGELLGFFKMGSTVLLFFQKDFCKLTVESDKYVKYGQQIGEVIDARE
ncbi:phosphatidylserine decarboxylase [Nitratiruptor sp. YY09-18]|uniref:phosphatidylserine decarboxylase n=1 Tax=Nitratiruptor sp. YY09-18 TaxID=2724901 RepID=UPI0019162C39|nr:phosphatidylserine decarboxylase [Nitratiruptor sp. YY09-18]